MLIDSNFNMSMVRSDTEAFRVSCKENGVVRNFVVGDIVHFTVKRTSSTATKILQKVIIAFTDGKAYVNISSADTSNIEPGEYVYDIQVLFADGIKKTLTAVINKDTGEITMPMFKLFSEVTYE